MSRKTETELEKRQRLVSENEIENRRFRFKELLGEDCGYIDALVVNTHISPWDVKKLLDEGCSRELIPKILL
jgi:hypothetical protein